MGKARDWLWGALGMFVVLLLVLFGLTSCARASEPFPRLVIYAGQRGGGYPLVRNDGKLDSSMCRAIARYPVVTVDANVGLARPDLLRLLKWYRRDVRVLGYHLQTHWWLGPSFVPTKDDSSFNAEWHRALLATNGWLSGAPAGYEVDWSRREVSDTLTSLMERVAKDYGFDGVFLDYCSPVISWTRATTAQQDSVRVENMGWLVHRLKGYLSREGEVVVGNGTGAEVLGLDGIMAEGFPYSLTTFDQAMTQRDGDWLKAEGTGRGDPKMARYVLGTACLTGARAAYGTDHYPVEPYEALWWFDEYAVTPLAGLAGGEADTTGAHIGWLGDALGPAYPWQGLWRRDFRKGCVLVNPRGSGVTVDFGRPYWRKIRGRRDPATNSGAVVQKVTVEANNALFLLSVRK